MNTSGERLALVTGASRGIGRAVAEHLASLGYRLVLASRHPHAAAGEIAKAFSLDVRPVVADIAAPDAAERMIAAAAEMGRLDALLLNHGSPAAAPFLDLPDAAWADHFQTMVAGPLRVLRGAVPLFRASGGGRVVAITSASVKAPHPGIILSNSLRAALVNALKTVAAELGPDNILCNAVAPGFTNVPATRERWNRYHAGRTRKTAEAVDRETLEGIPLRRYGEPQDVAALAGYLLSDANRYVTGQHITVDGGATASV
jgi:3-oxoacyl-[acyl-carrier protein] reductase